MFRRVSSLWALVVLAAPCQGQDLWCINCREHYDVNGDWIGTGRLDNCPCCRAQDCADAAAKADRLRATYGPLRSRYDSVRQEIAALRAENNEIPRALSSEEAKLNFDLGQLELQYAILKQECPAQVAGNLWDDAGGPVEDSPAAADAASRPVRAADKAAKNYQRIAHDEAHQLDVLLHFLGAAADGYAPPISGFNGERVQAARQYAELAAGFAKEAEKLAKPGSAGAPDDAKPKDFALPKLKVPAGADALVKQQAAALQARLNANAYLKAYFEARQAQRVAEIGKDAEAAKKFGRDAVKYIWLAREGSLSAARLQRAADASHQKSLDESLAAAAQNGVALGELLKRFQARVKANGVPAETRQALANAGAGDEEVQAVEKRLLALTEEDVNRVLEARRKQLNAPPDAIRGADAFVLEAQYMATRAAFHRPMENVEKKD